jgi:hypothetical protein
MLFDKKGNQSKLLILFGIFAPLITSIIFSVWGLKLTINSDKDRQQIDTLTKQLQVLQKIYIASDSTSKATMNLKQLPKKFSELSSTLDVLNGTLKKETEKIGKSYDALNDNYASLIKQQKSYLDDISKVTKLTNEQVLALKKNNEAIDIEFSRRADVEVYAVIKRIDTKNYLDRIRISNKGEIECEIGNLDIIILNPDFVCPEINSDGCLYLFKPSIFKFKNSCTPKQVNKGTPLEIEFIKESYFTSNLLNIQYNLSYSNKYESKSISGVIKLVAE